jgi:hypothetical protein
MPERVQIDGRNHYSSYLQKKEKYTSKPQEDYVMPATIKSEQTLQCCDRVFRSFAALKRHTVVNHKARKPISKRKRPTKVGFKRRVVRRVVQSSSESEEESKSEDGEAKESSDELPEVVDELDAELEDVHVAAMDMDTDQNSIGESDQEMDEPEKYEHFGIIGAVAVTGRQPKPSEFFIRYPKEPCINSEGWTSINSECLLLPTEEFESSLVNPPKADREALKWCNELEGREMFFRFGKVGCDYWYHALIGGYNSGSQEHEVKPSDGSKVLIVNLLKSKKSIMKAWRFVQEGEDVNTTLDELNA